MNFGILGGDSRYKFLYEMLKDEGNSVKSYNNKDIEDCKNFDYFFKDLDIIIAPIPFSKDNKNIFFPEAEQISIKLLIDKMAENNVATLFGGVLEKQVIDYAEGKGIKIFDFFEDEQVAILNAIPTAEGAIQTAMVESDKTIFDSNCLVLGYGRCGKILANMLKGIGANVTVSYRKKEDYAYIKAYGLKEMKLYNIEDSFKNFDYIFNTIPDVILNKENLEKVDKETIIIDLAQAPGGIDYNFARKLKLKAFYCPGLPGRVAPFTAAKILKESILNIYS